MAGYNGPARTIVRVSNTANPERIATNKRKTNNNNRFIPTDKDRSKIYIITYIAIIY